MIELTAPLDLILQELFVNRITEIILCNPRCNRVQHPYIYSVFARKMEYCFNKDLWL